MSGNGIKRKYNDYALTIDVVKHDYHDIGGNGSGIKLIEQAAKKAYFEVSL
ncbi:hypothetical protein OZY43_03435 [Lactobacillus sp. ESL0785]|uniref:hypothetical protein n=1 Tax=Lactobacillus sp. ESL0785 TaxID=2983232 RepID=UPI0023F85396|nr:hypothetical protein [Lactobacillus sp. ESL0785]WEV71465.1 hypothetical protein OZY43_03435 [Lactobacillus sp. ESL0785]